MPSSMETRMISFLVVVAYFIAAFLAWRRAEKTEFGNDPMLWASIAMLVLALNHQLEFILTGIAWAKGLAKEQGWYLYRWPLLAFTIASSMVIASVPLIRNRKKFRRPRLSTAILLSGTGILGSYLFLRATSMHWVDPWIGVHLGCPRTNPWIEFFGAVVFCAGFCLCRKSSPRIPAVVEASECKSHASHPR